MQADVQFGEQANIVESAVAPANIDIATQEIIQMAEDADPDGRRTLGVLTKPDLVDQGAEEKVRVENFNWSERY